MIVLDSSAILAILLEERGFEELRSRLGTSQLVSAATRVEASLVMGGRHGAEGLSLLASFLARPSVQIVPFDDAQAELAIEAFLRYGKGRHPARLNFGDCISYALAAATGRPLLWVGDDFDLTDAKRA